MGRLLLICTLGLVLAASAHEVKQTNTDAKSVSHCKDKPFWENLERTCEADKNKLCGGLQDKELFECMERNAAELSEACRPLAAQAIRCTGEAVKHGLKVLKQGAKEKQKHEEPPTEQVAVQVPENKEEAEPKEDKDDTKDSEPKKDVDSKKDKKKKGKDEDDPWADWYDWTGGYGGMGMGRKGHGHRGQPHEYQLKKGDLCKLFLGIAAYWTAFIFAVCSVCACLKCCGGDVGTCARPLTTRPAAATGAPVAPEYVSQMDADEALARRLQEAELQQASRPEGPPPAYPAPAQPTPTPRPSAPASPQVSMAENSLTTPLIN